MRWVPILAGAALGATLVFVVVSETPRKEIVATAGAPQLPPSASMGSTANGGVLPLPPSPAARALPPQAGGEPQAGEDPQADPQTGEYPQRGGENSPAVTLPLPPQVPPSSAADSTSNGSALRARLGEAPPDLIAKRLTIPVEGIAAEQLTPAFFDARGERGHEAIDIMAPEGRPVLAAEDGRIATLYTSVAGGLTIYQFDPTGRYAYYYAHLDAYAPGLAEGAMVKRGQPIGTVGSSGNASAAGPHLHFAIFRLGPEKNWWKGEAVDPYPAFAREASKAVAP